MRARVHNNARVIELAASFQGPLRLRRGSRGVRASAFARQEVDPTSCLLISQIETPECNGAAVKAR